MSTYRTCLQVMVFIRQHYIAFPSYIRVNVIYHFQQFTLYSLLSIQQLRTGDAVMAESNGNKVYTSCDERYMVNRRLKS